MKVIDKKNNIARFSINESIFLFKDRIYGKFKNLTFFEIVNGITLFLNDNQKVLNEYDFPNIPENYFYKLSSASNEYFILVDENSLDLATFLYTKEALYSVVNKEIIYIGSVIGNRIFQNYVVNGIGQSFIEVFDIEKCSKITSFLLDNIGSQIDTPYQVSEFCDIYKDVLISTMSNGNILLLGIEKGEPIKLFKDTKVLGGIFQKKDSSPIYIGLKFKTYIEIDVEKAEITKKIDLEEYFKQKFNRAILAPINTTVYQKGLIYFIADTNIVGVFDPEKTEVIDFYEFKFENKQTMLKGGKENLQVKDNNIYCLDNQDNLYTLNLTSSS